MTLQFRGVAQGIFLSFFAGKLVEIVTKTNPFFDIITRIARFVRFNETESF